MKTITEHNFYADRMKDYPWCQKDLSGRHAVYYAVCPHCENPIQLIGLFKRESNTPRLYGKHTDKRIPGFSYFEPGEYASCPYYHPDKTKNRVALKRNKLSFVPLKIIERLQKEFDNAIALIENVFGFSISYPLAEKMLENYLLNEGYLYFSSTLQNTFWMFAFRAADESLFGQQVNDPELRQTLKKNIAHLYFDPDSNRLSKNPNGKTYYITFMIGDYGCKISNHTAVEVMWLNIYNTDEQIVWKKKIIFDYEHAEQFLSNLNMPFRRRQKFLEISHRLIGAKFPDLDELVRKAELSIING